MYIFRQILYTFNYLLSRLNNSQTIIKFKETENMRKLELVLYLRVYS